jgi:hypothetical protein
MRRGSGSPAAEAGAGGPTKQTFIETCSGINQPRQWPRRHSAQHPLKGLIMHSIVLLTALSATSGIFGGGRTQQCSTGQCPNVAYAAPAATHAAAPAPQYYSAPAPMAQAAAPRRQWFRTARMTYAAPATTCSNGTCYRR